MEGRTQNQNVYAGILRRHVYIDQYYLTLTLATT